MSVYPGAIDEFREVENLEGIVYKSEDKKTVFAEDTNNHSNAIVAVETTLGENPQGASDTVADRLAALEGIVADLDDRYYPVGTIYGNGVDTTSPASLLGFGTWTPYAVGRVIAGVAPAGTFGTVGGTMGAEKHTLTNAEMPVHRHPMWIQGGGATNTSAFAWATVPNARSYTGSDADMIRNSGGGGAHNNIQPTVVAAYWIRTA